MDAHSSSPLSSMDNLDKPSILFKGLQNVLSIPKVPATYRVLPRLDAQAEERTILLSVWVD